MTGCTKVRLWAEKEKKVLALDCNKSIELLIDYSFRPPKWKIIGNALVPTLVSSKLFVMICFLNYLDAFNESTYCEQMSLTQLKKLALGLVGIKFQKRVPAL